MMRLSTMQAVVETMEEDGTSPIADEICVLWNADSGSVKFFRASANFVFKFTIAGQKYVLRFNHETERTVERIQAEIEYVNNLAAKNILVAKPVLSKHGNYVESVPTKLGLFHAVVFEALQGDQWETDELTPEMFAAWGKALGNLHNASQGYVGNEHATWQQHISSIAESLPQEEYSAQAQLTKIKEQLTQLPTDANACGLIHFDFETDNIIWTHRGIEAIDFDESAWYWFVADVAFALRDIFDDDPDKVDLTHISLCRFVAGYREVRSLTDDDLTLLPLFLRFHNLITFAKLSRTIGPDNLADAPRWVENLRNKLVATMTRYRKSFS